MTELKANPLSNGVIEFTLYFTDGILHCTVPAEGLEKPSISASLYYEQRSPASMGGELITVWALNVARDIQAFAARHRAAVSINGFVIHQISQQPVSVR